MKTSNTATTASIAATIYTESNAPTDHYREMLLNMEADNTLVSSNHRNLPEVAKKSINDLLNDATLLNLDTYEFYEWKACFSSLVRRYDMQIPRIKFLVKEELIDADNMYLWMKNVSPLAGGSFDDTRISTLDTDTYLGGFCFQHWGHTEGGSAYFFIKDQVTGIVTKHEYESWKELKSALKNDEELRATVRATFHPNYVAPVIEEVVKVEKPKKVAKPKKSKKEDVVEVIAGQKVNLNKVTIYATEDDMPIPEKRSRKAAEVKVETVNEEDIIV